MQTETFPGDMRPSDTSPRNLAECTAVVTGASSGIGRAIALALAAEGAAVCMIGRSADRLKKVEAEAEAAGARDILTVCADLTDDDALDAMMRAVNDRFDAADTLILSAGAYARSYLADAPIADLDALYALNLRAPYRLLQHMLPLLRRRRGDILLINSTQGVRASAGVSQYSAIHHARRAVADSLRDEINADGVRVTVMHVGRTATPLQARIHADASRRYVPEDLIQPDDIASMVVATLRLPRTAEVTDITIRPMKKP